jgi:hypothetical protein
MPKEVESIDEFQTNAGVFREAAAGSCKKYYKKFQETNGPH